MSGKAASSLTFSCKCGEFCGHVTDKGAKAATHVVCFCPDCRAAELYFDQPDPAPNPVGILQLSPEAVVFDKGSEQLALMQLGPKGLLRWYAKCCNTPVLNTFRSAKVPFASVSVKALHEPEKLGPVVSRGFVPQADGRRKHENAGRAALALFSRMIVARLSGRWKKTPFFDPETGSPVREPLVLSKEARSALYP